MPVVEKAKELGQMIVESQEFIALQKAEIRQNNDAEAIQLIANYNVKRNELMVQMQAPDVSKEKMEEVRSQMEAEFDILSANEAIGEYIESTQNFQQMMTQVNSVISHYVNGDRNGSDCESGNCGSCGGGCH